MLYIWAFFPHIKMEAETAWSIDHIEMMTESLSKNKAFAACRCWVLNIHCKTIIIFSHYISHIYIVYWCFLMTDITRKNHRHKESASHRPRRGRHLGSVVVMGKTSELFLFPLLAHCDWLKQADERAGENDWSTAEKPGSGNGTIKQQQLSCRTFPVYRV